MFCSCRKVDTSEWPDIPVKATPQVNDGDYTIKDGKISEKVLRNYLSRAITEAEFATKGTADDERMLLNVGAKFIGRAMYTWNGESMFNNEATFNTAKDRIARMHAKDPDMIFQCAIFECVGKQVEQIKIPDWVFKAFGKEPEDRTFKFDNIRDESGTNVGTWGANTCVPDLSREEAQMWFYYAACRYMEVGCEAIHCGQVTLECSMGDKDNDYAGYRNMQRLVREAAKTKARRGFVMMDAHCASVIVDGHHLFDFGAYPLRLKEVPDAGYNKAELKKGYGSSIIGKTRMGITPSGWKGRIPYILEFDNYGTSTHPGKAADDYYVWGYDEISWFGCLTDEQEQEFVKEAVDYMNETDPIGYIEMPGLRGAVFTNAHSYANYRCNMKSDACPQGRNLENTIKELWK